MPKNITEMMLQYLVTSYFMNKSLAPSPKKFNFEFTKSLLKCQLRVAFYPSRYILVDQLIHSFLLTLCLSVSLSSSMKELSIVLISATIQSGFVTVQPFEIHNTYHKLIKNQVISTSRIIC